MRGVGIVMILLLMLSLSDRGGYAQEPAQETSEGEPSEIFCKNVQDRAQDIRFLWQSQRLLELEKKLAERILVFEKEKKDYQDWLKKRDDFKAKAQAHLIDIYATSKPDAAAPQIMAMDDVTASSILSQLNPKTAALILAEIDPVRAAQLVKILSDLGSTNMPRK